MSGTCCDLANVRLSPSPATVGRNLHSPHHKKAMLCREMHRTFTIQASVHFPPISPIVLSAEQTVLDQLKLCRGLSICNLNQLINASTDFLKPYFSPK